MTTSREFVVDFTGHGQVTVGAGTLLSDAAVLAGVEIGQPCGGQGRCGRCAVKMTGGTARRRSTLRLSPEDVKAGYALACQTVVTGPVTVAVPETAALERRLTSDRIVAPVVVPAGYDPNQDQCLRRLSLQLAPPTLDDQRDDWGRLAAALRTATGAVHFEADLANLQTLGAILRAEDWQVTATVLLSPVPGAHEGVTGRLLTLTAGAEPAAPLWGISVDIGTTTVSVWLVDLISGEVVAQAAEYNRQIARGEDVISRVMYAGKDAGQAELRTLVLKSINTLIERVCLKARRVEAFAATSLQPDQIMKATIAGNSIMMHLLLGIPAASIRLMPFVTAVNELPPLMATAVGLCLHPTAPVFCLPGVASYVGADITAGVLASGLDRALPVTLFMDIGTNGELVLGGHEWLVTCACSAGPAFEGAGVHDGMRATGGAIEEVWVDGATFEPTLRVIGGERPRGLCGSGLISLLAELFLTGVIDKGGHVNLDLPNRRTRVGASGPEYVVAWADGTAHGQDIVLTHVDIDNLLRAKAAIYAGIAVLASSVGLPLEAIEQVLIGGAFGKYINVEKAIQIGLLPDLNGGWQRFHFLGNTSVLGAYHALLRQTSRARIGAIAGRMTYIELSADNAFYEAFTSALFLPHTDMRLFPTVAAELAGLENRPVVTSGLAEVG